MKEETRTFYEQVVDGALERLVARLDAPLDLGDLARRAALSPLHFHRIFRGIVGETPVEVHRRLRLERAASRLARERTQVTRIAFDTGYETHESFTRAFRDAYAVSPTEFRTRAHEARLAGERPPPCELAARSGIHFTEGSLLLSLRLTRERTTMNVDVHTLSDLRVAAVSYTGPYARIFEAFARLDAIVRSSTLHPDAPEGALVAIFHDDPEATAASDLRADAGIVVTGAQPLPVGLTAIHIPAGRYARTTHVGPYTRLGDTWSRFMGEWLPASGHRIGRGVTYERYRNTPMTAKPDDLVTDLYLPIE